MRLNSTKKLSVDPSNFQDSIYKSISIIRLKNLMITKCILFSTLVIISSCQLEPEKYELQRDKTTTSPSSSVDNELFLKLEFIGEAVLDTSNEFQNTIIGGLSGIDYDINKKQFITISDDRAEYGPARFYKLSIDLEDGRLSSDDVKILSMVEILTPEGRPFSKGSIDPESLRIDPRSNLIYWTSEGNANKKIPPTLKRMDYNGTPISEYKIPEKYFPTSKSGVRNNMAFEGLSIIHTPEKKPEILISTENALIQDGDTANLSSGSHCRLLIIDLEYDYAIAEYIYVTEPVVDKPLSSNAFNTNGIVEVLAINHNYWLVLERSYTADIGNQIKLFLVDRRIGTDVFRHKSIKNLDIIPLKKKLVFNFTDLGFKIDNIEGMSFGPTLDNGEQTLIFISDNNFNLDKQITQLLAFKFTI